jgi:hypothetical protein
MADGLQNQVFEIILNKYARRADAVNEMCRALDMAKDPLYRRMRGDTILSPNELSLLALHFQISLDRLILPENNQVLWDYNAFSHKVTDFNDYLAFFEHEISLVTRMPNVHMLFASVELPVFTYAFFPELISFKLYVWGRTTWNLPAIQQRPFDFDLVTQPMIRLTKNILNHYLGLPSTELWSVLIMDNTLAQIEYHVYSGGFRNPKDALILCDKLAEWSIHMKAIAAAGRKFDIGEKPELGRASLSLYHNEMLYTNITTLLSADTGRMAYAAFCNPNFMKCTDPKLCDYLEDWFQTIISKSSPISSSAEKGRDWFFKEMTRKLDRVRQRIQLHIEDNG